MTINGFLQKYRRVGAGGLNVTRPRVRCADGFTASVQAGRGIYSMPREDAERYTHVEIGYPSVREDLWMDYAENVKAPKDTVYGHVPVEIVDKALEKHGGIAGADFSNCGSEWEDGKNDVRTVSATGTEDGK